MSSTKMNHDVSLTELNLSNDRNSNRIRSTASVTGISNKDNKHIEQITHLGDDCDQSGTMHRRRYTDQQSSTNGTRSLTAPVLTTGKDGTTTIEMDIMNDENGFYVRWSNLSYTVQPNWYQGMCNAKSKTILNNLNGFFLSGELIALMGPSGAGKTTLLECLSLKNKEGISGDIVVVGKPKVRIALVPQYDDILPQFTVSETIFYASRYKNRTYDISHRNIVRRVIQQLGLEVCQNNSITRCSGGQKKRVAIAQELVKRPNILILDEPTSGLDSSSCSQTIGVLRQIIDSSSSPLAIVTTIHQPSARVMTLFDRVYLLASGGRLAYNGSPTNIVPTLKLIGCPCPPFYNPIDHLIEIVAGDYEQSKVDHLIRLEQSRKYQFNARLEAVSAQSLRKAILFDPCPTEDHIKIHTQRCTIQLLRDPILFSLRIILHFVMAVFFATLWGYNIGKGSACPTFNKQSISPIAVALSGNLTKDEQIDLEYVNDTILFTIYSGMFSMYAATMITVLSFPLDVKVLSREYYNGWYSVTTYLIGKITADTPFQMMCVTMFAGLAFFLTNQPTSDYYWRFIVYAYSLICLSLLSQTQGLIVGAIFMRSLAASVFVGPLTITPVFLFSGFARRYSRMADYLKPVVKMSYFHHALRTIFASLYGFGRCKCNPSDYQLDLNEVDYEDINTISKTHSSLSFGSSSSSIDLTDPTQTTAVYIGKFRCDDSFQSIVMHELSIEDNDMYIGMGILFVYLLVMRGLVLLLLLYKVKR